MRDFIVDVLSIVVIFVAAAVLVLIFGGCNGHLDAGASHARPEGDCARVAVAYSGAALTATVQAASTTAMVVLACDDAGVCRQQSGGEALGISGASAAVDDCAHVCPALVGQCVKVTLPSSQECVAKLGAICRRVGP
jgi:hypothetical protein